MPHREYPLPEHLRPRSRKSRRRERRDAARHGFDDLTTYRQWRYGTPGDRRLTKHTAKQDASPSGALPVRPNRDPNGGHAMTGAPSPSRPDSLALAQAATAVAGPRPVLEVALELAGAARELDGLLDRLDGCARFPATIVDAVLEPSSTRLLVTVRTRPDADDEQLRTDRTDDAWGQIMAGRVRRHLGRRVLIAKELDDAGPGKKVRVLVWFDVLDDHDDSDGTDATDGAPRQAPPPHSTPPPDQTPLGAPSELPTDSQRTPNGDADGAPSTDTASNGAPSHPTPSGARSERDQLLDQVHAAIGTAGIPDDHLAALLAARFHGAGAIDDLDERQLRWFAQRMVTDGGTQTVRRAAAEDFAAVGQPVCSTCHEPSPDLDNARECPACRVPF